MTIDLEVAARHEAGHAVMYWYVGLATDMECIRLDFPGGKFVGGQVKAKPLDVFRCKNSAYARRQLLILMGGALGNDDPQLAYNASDFTKIKLVLAALFCEEINSHPKDGLAVKNPTPNAFLQDAANVANQLFALSEIAQRVGSVATLLAKNPPDRHGVIVLPKQTILDCCAETGTADSVPYDLKNWCDTPFSCV